MSAKISWNLPNFEINRRSRKIADNRETYSLKYISTLPFTLFRCILPPLHMKKRKTKRTNEQKIEWNWRNKKKCNFYKILEEETVKFGKIAKMKEFEKELKEIRINESDEKIPFLFVFNNFFFISKHFSIKSEVIMCMGKRN